MLIDIAIAATNKGRTEALDVFVAMITVDPTFLARSMQLGSSLEGAQSPRSSAS